VHPQRPPIWTRDFTLLWMANFLMATSFYFLLPTVPGFSVSVLGANKSQVGYLISVYTVSALLIRPAAGYLLDVKGRKITYIGGLIAYALLIFSYPAATSFLFLLAIRFVHGLGWGTLTTGGSTVAADLLPGQRRGEGLGYYGLTMTLAMAFGPLLAVQLAAGGQYNRLFLIAGTIAALAMCIGLVVRYPQVAPSRGKFTWRSVLHPRVLPVAAISLFTMASYGGIVSFLTLFTEERGLNTGVFFLIYAAAMSLSRPFAGRVLDRRGPTLVLGGGIALLVLGYATLGFSQSLPLFALAAVLLGVGNGNVLPTVQGMAINLVGSKERGVATSTLFSATDLGIGLGSTILGWIADASSLSTMYVFSGLLLLIPLTFFFAYVNRYYASHKEREVHK